MWLIKFSTHTDNRKITVLYISIFMFQVTNGKTEDSEPNGTQQSTNLLSS
jgi:hypothetical protein